jgi:polyisoprenoid-binding protein YceI
MLLPGALAILTPVIVGFSFGPEVLAATLAGVAVSGVLMAMFQSNAGGAWDNAKKSFEKGVEIHGQMYYKGSDPHKAAVTGDTVGDPFKDTSGPSMNILIKLTAIVSLVIAPLLHTSSQANEPYDSQKTLVLPVKDLSTLRGNYPLDVNHSFVDFSIRHFVSSAHGSMQIDTGLIVMTGDPKTSTVYLKLNVASLNTSNKSRDNKMMESEFFDVANNPSIMFNSTSIDRLPANDKSGYTYVAHGDLTIKGVTKKTDVFFNYLGDHQSVYNGQKGPMIYSFEGTTSINRVEYGVGKGNLDFLGDDVKINFSVESAI